MSIDKCVNIRPPPTCIHLQETDFSVYWVEPGITPSGTNNVFGATPFGYVQNTGLDIEIPGNNATLTGTTAADALTLTVRSPVCV